MKRSVLLLAIAFVLASCKPTKPETINPCDLSAKGTANCYVISSPSATEGEYFFKANVPGNGSNGVTFDLEGAYVKQIWADGVSAVLGDLRLREDGCAAFSVDRLGNYLVGLYDSNDNLLWSWHIWYPIDNVCGIEAANGLEFMNMNLGAKRDRGVTSDRNYEAYGLLYQWGRKDPFMNHMSLNGTSLTMPDVVYDGEGNPVEMTRTYSASDRTLEYATAHPYTVISWVNSENKDWLSESNDDLWGGVSGKKTVYDPCPVGWKVPAGDAFDFLSTSGTNYTTDFQYFNVADINGDRKISGDDYKSGWYVNLVGNQTFFPAAARYDAGYAMLMGSMLGYWGNYWTSKPEDEGCASALGFRSKDINFNDIWSLTPRSIGARAFAFSVRCVKE